MEKLKKILKWVGTDGLLHFLVCFSMMLAFTPLIGIWRTLCATLLAAFAKEGMDYFIEKDNNISQVLHDLICDAVGLVLAVGFVLIW
jgi:predicted PurR-regulated permease PerM